MDSATAAITVSGSNIVTLKKMPSERERREKMSFNGQVRQELSRQIAQTHHCRTAELAALLSFCGNILITDEDEIILHFETEQEAVCSVYMQLLKKRFHIESSQVLYEERIRNRSSRYSVEIDEPGLVSEILQAVGVMEPDGSFSEEKPLEDRTFLQKTCCRRAWVKGAFLSAGVISDPDRSYHAELVCTDAETAESAAEIMTSLGLSAAVSKRGRYSPVYIKEGAQISDLLGMIDARVAMMDFENARILREVRGNINRKVNCETANIQKTADAAAAQIEDILFIRSIGGANVLPPILDEMACIRVKYPQKTLQELGNMLNPPVGKSGVNHRLRRISAIAGQLRREQGEDHGK
ncbi:MAG: DNA-binding protein WhiA [Eubacterium sp.]|nr:DNA-binding protein WhiA [Eubacterium sp.]